MNNNYFISIDETKEELMAENRYLIKLDGYKKIVLVG